ncbi:hypothetical protein LF1_32880 [Rubripirellula obstinata]|uniref:Uncharacterized protein n=2 Tax=Rubripirellula obstinata TaxID=406547 RepID=A0A5B1CHS7_9BACT|nr:hypothetical protein LF1_32880 [Rubripirellula obstinata]
MELRQHHASLNEKSRSLRDCYASHRQQIMRLICDYKGEPVHQKLSSTNVARIAVLGAGNCNDIDLSSLTQQFDEVHLVDLDSDAIDFANSHPGVDQDRIHRHCPVDLASPLLELLEPVVLGKAASRPTSIADDWIERLRLPPQPLPIPPCDVVVSVGLLSQLMLSIDLALDHLPPTTTLPLIQTVRREHFRRVTSMLRPATHDRSGGIAVFGFDFVSSASAAEILRTPDDQLGPLAMKLINERNFFSGMNPGVLLNELKSISAVRMIHVEPPWRWTLGRREYLMMAVVLERTDVTDHELST